MKNSINPALAWGGVLLAGALWGGGAVVAQFAIERGMSPYSLAFARFALGLPLLWLWHWRACARALAQHALQAPSTPGSIPAAAPSGLRRETWRTRALVMGIGVALALSVSCWFAAIAVLGAALPTVISVCCAPVVVALVSVLRGYERLTFALLAALALGLAGVLLIALPEAGWELPEAYATGIALSLACAVLHALVVLGNARMPARVSAVEASAWGMTAAAGCMALLALAQGITWPVGAPVWWSVAYTGVVTTSVAYLLFAWGARQLGPTAAGVCILVEPLVATLLVGWLFAEALSPQQWLGAALLGLSMLLLARRVR